MILGTILIFLLPLLYLLFLYVKIFSLPFLYNCLQCSLSPVYLSSFLFVFSVLDCDIFVSSHVIPYVSHIILLALILL